MTACLSHQFFSNLQPDIMLNYPHNDVLVTTARVALFLHLVLNYPVLLHPTRSSINLLFALLYNTLQNCLTRKRQYRAESEPLLPKSSHTEFKVQGLSLFPTVSLHPHSSPLIDSPPSVVLRDLDHLWCYLSTSQFHTQCKTSTSLWATLLQWSRHLLVYRWDMSGTLWDRLEAYWCSMYIQQPST